MTFYITISLICLVSFLIILFSLNNQKDSLEKQLKDTSSVNTSITVVKILLIISLGVFCFGIYVTFESDIKNAKESNNVIVDIKNFGRDLLSNASSIISPPVIMSDQWISTKIKNFIK